MRAVWWRKTKLTKLTGPCQYESLTGLSDTYFPDISEFQPSADIAVIRKATGAIAACILYGTTPDKSAAAGRIGAIRTQKFDAVIYYIFMRPPSHGPSVAQQFQATRNMLPTLLPGEAVCVDWEVDPFPANNKMAASASDRDALLTMLDNYYGQPTVLYGSASSLAGYRAARPVWVASYGVNTEPAGHHTMWQYTNGVYDSAHIPRSNWPGAGFCDTSIFHGTSQQLGAILSLKKGPNGVQLNKPISGIVTTKTGGGYWLYAQDGGVFAFGDAQSFTDPLPAQPLAAPIVGAGASPSDRGLTLVGADGGVFCLGDAQFHGSVPGLKA